MNADTNTIVHATRTVTVPWGYIDEGGTLHQDITVRELGDEEDRMLGTPGHDITEIITSCILSVGGISDRRILKTTVFPEILKDDADTLLFDIRDLTFSGDPYKFNCECPSCRKTSLYAYDLELLDLEEPEDPLDRDIEFVTREGVTVTFRPLVIGDNPLFTKIHASVDIFRKVAALRLKTAAGETLDDWVRRTLIGRKPKKDPEGRLSQALQWFQAVVPSYRDRELIRSLFQSKKAGYNPRIELQCPTCKHVFNTWMPVDPGFLKPSEGPGETPFGTQ